MRKKKKQISSDATIENSINDSSMPLLNNTVVLPTPTIPTNGVNYTGSIKVSIKKDGKVVKSISYHNSGSRYLFEFLCKCISGQLSEQDAPKYLRLFSFNTIPTEIPVGICEASTAVGSALAFNASSIEITTSNTNSSEDTAKVTLHFTVPGTACITNASKFISIYQAGLYNANHIDEVEKLSYSAAFNLVDSSGTEWDPITFNLANGEYNIYIEWTLIFSNAN